jgi:septum formation protein
MLSTVPVALVLASSSPRRQQLLRGLGLELTVEPADIDETELPGEPPIGYVTRVAGEKVATVAERLNSPSGVVVLGADTTVEVDGRILAKPVDDDDARRMLGLLSGRTHQVHTAVVAWAGGQSNTVAVTTGVTFTELDAGLIEWYIARGEHRDKAGAYAMQGAAAALVASIDGSPSNVIGLPLSETVALLRAAGIALSCGGV